MILGHEAVGEVVETGSLVRDFRPGDRVIVPAITPDWGSVEAQAGYAMHSGGMLAGWKFSNYKDGVFAERFHVNEADANLAHLPRGVKIEDAVMLSDMVPTGFHGAELADVQYGESVCVIGIGPVGLMAVAAARLRGAGRLFAVGSRPRCAEAARFYGATDLVNYREGDIVAQIMDATGARGVDKVILAGGGCETFAQAVEMLRPGGKIGNVNNYCIAVKENGDDIVFLRKIVRGGADKSYGIQVAKLAGVPDLVINRAKELAEELAGADITVHVQGGEAEQAKQKKTKPAKLDPVDLDQMSLFDTVKDDDVLKELKELDLGNLTPIEALNTLYQLQNKLKNRW